MCVSVQYRVLDQGVWVLFGGECPLRGLSGIAELGFEAEGRSYSCSRGEWATYGDLAAAGIPSQWGRGGVSGAPEAGSPTPPVPTAGRALAMASHGRL